MTQEVWGLLATVAVGAILAIAYLLSDIAVSLYVISQKR